MTRPIRFRAWDLISKEMIYLNDVLCTVPYYEIFCHTPDDRPWQLMESTELKDCNGKEIFEGDIIRYTPGDIDEDGDEYYFDHASQIEQVIFDPCVGIFGMFKKEIAPSQPCKIEVIGNIYETPDLLEK